MGAIVRRVSAIPPIQTERLAEAPDGAFTDLRSAVALERPGGVYAVFATRNGRRVIRLAHHFNRLIDSAQRVGFAVTLDAATVRQAVCAILRESGLQEARIRISVHPDDVNAACPLLVAAEPFSGPDPSLRVHGVSCMTTVEAHRETPRAKQTGWLHDRAGLGRPNESVYEHLLVNADGRILEGATSNFYAITPGGERPVLRTAGDGVLYGIARSIVLEAASSLLDVVLEPVARGDLPGISEAFMTSASRGIVPIVQIDGRPIGSGAPGPVTGELIDRYERRATELEESLCANEDW